MDKVKLLGLLGLARRAGKLTMGFNGVDQLVRRGQNPFVIVAKDAGPSQKNKFLGWQPVRGFLGDLLTAEEMARTLGREKLVVVGLCDRGFIKGIQKMLQDEASDEARDSEGKSGEPGAGVPRD